MFLWSNRVLTSSTKLAKRCSASHLFFVFFRFPFLVALRLRLLRWNYLFALGVVDHDPLLFPITCAISGNHSLQQQDHEGRSSSFVSFCAWDWPRTCAPSIEHASRAVRSERERSPKRNEDRWGTVPMAIDPISRELLVLSDSGRPRLDRGREETGGYGR